MKIWIVLFLLLSSFGCAQKSKKEASFVETTAELKGELKLDVKRFVLSNGLKVLILENPNFPIFSYYTFFDVGGRHEGKGTTGATHFLEHMMFKGAKKYGPQEFDSLIEKYGGSTNAYTNFDSTVYYEHLPTAALNTIIDLEADRIEHLLLEKKAFESERKVIFEERKMRYENSPRGKLYLKMMQTVFKGTPYGGSVIGSVDDLKKLTQEQMRSFFKRFYTPDNATIVIVGDVKADNVMKEVVKRFGHLESSMKETQEYKKEKNNPSKYTHRAKFGETIKIKGKSELPMFMMAFPGKPITTKDGFIMDMLSSILGDGSSSYLNKQFVVNKKPKLSSIGAANYTLKYNGVFFIQGQLLPGEDLSKIKKELSVTLEKSCNNAISKRSLQKTKNQYLARYYSDIETNAGVAEFLGLRELFHGDYAFYEKELEIYKNITLKDVIGACETLFKDKEGTFISIWKNHE